ncbi:MAG TPA: NlpC/P60 family protein [Kineosporiaceae bacterium]
MTDHWETVRRGGVVVALSGGLVATMSVPGTGPLELVSSVEKARPPRAGGRGAVITGPGTTAAAGVLAEAPMRAPRPATPEAAAHRTQTPVHPRPPGATGSRRAVAVAGRAGRPAQGTRHVSPHADLRAELPTSAPGPRAAAIALRYVGVPYRWGGTTPRGFDCSGLTQYVFRQVGKRLGRTVADQLRDVTIVPRSRARVGDLIFFGTHHIAIYLGGNTMLAAPHTGTTVQVQEIYSPQVSFGRV